MGPYSKHSGRLVTALARVRGLGSARDGTGHFIMQRLTALALVPLTLWFVVGVIAHINAPYDVFRAWASGLFTATALALVVGVTFWHTALGLCVVVEDYVHHELAKILLLVAVRFGCFACAVLGLLAIIRLAA